MSGRKQYLNTADGNVYGELTQGEIRAHVRRILVEMGESGYDDGEFPDERIDHIITLWAEIQCEDGTAVTVGDMIADPDN